MVVPVLFPISIAGALMLPDWANGVSLIEELIEGDGDDILPQPYQFSIVSAGSYRINQAPDLLSYKPHLRAQRYLIEQLVGYFGAHSAISAWQLGDGLEYIHLPRSTAAVERWYAIMADAVRAQRPKARTIAMISAQGLRHSHGPRPAHAIAHCDAIAVSAAPPEPEHARRRSDYSAFLQHLVSGLCERHALVSDLGIATSPVKGGEWRISSHAGHSAQVFFGDSEQQATYLEVALSRLLQAGAAGAWLPAYSDYGQAHWTSPPLERSPHSRSQGLIDITGREKAAAQAVQSFSSQLGQASRSEEQESGEAGMREQQQPKAGQLQEAVQRPVPSDIDPERYWRDPDSEFARLWREWVTDG